MFTIHFLVVYYRMMKYIILCCITTIAGEMLFNIEINLICHGMK
jgi:hypothetical protein